MEKITFSTAVKNVKKNLWLLFSTLAALCLFSLPLLSSIIFIISTFVVVIVAAVFDVAKPTNVTKNTTKIAHIFLTILIVYMGFNSFNTTWIMSDKVASLAGALGITTSLLLLIVGGVGCVVGAYAMYVLAYWIVSWFVMLLKERLPIQDKSEIRANLKRNWYFPISAIAFFFLNATLTHGYIIGMLIAFVIAIFIASQISSLWSYTKNHSNSLRMLSIITAIGICLAVQESFYVTWSTSSKVQVLEALLPVAVDIPGVISIIGGIAAVYFVYLFVLVFWNCIIETLKNFKFFCEVKIVEWVIYSLLLIISFSFVFFSFTRSQVFYGTEFFIDIIYTSDSPTLVKGNVYLALTHFENDLRQPLFAVFAAPFTGIPYLVARLIDSTASIQAILINCAQIIMMFAANLLLSKMMKLNSMKRICFMLLTSCTYTYLLFMLMMEQYIVAYFYLVFCMYLIVEKKQPNRIALWGAGGTLLTSMVLLPFMSSKSLIRDFKNWFMDMMKYVLEFVVLILGFCRFDVIFNLVSKISQLSGFTGKSVAFADKIYQYTEFIVNCFVAPNAGVNTTAFDHISWQLNTATGINFVGVLILVLAIFSAIWNHDKKISLLSVGWIVFSLVMLLGLGWGTKENGLILYALYFGWAFLVLLFQLIEKIESKLNIRFLIPIFTVCTVVMLLIINIPAIMEMVNFAITYYPV